MKLTSPAFRAGDILPEKYTCRGINVNPPLCVQDIPEAAECLALIAEDPDGSIVYWVVYDVPLAETVLEDSCPGKQGKNSFGQSCYTGPCPSEGVHRYFFKCYALSGNLPVKEGEQKETVIDAMQGRFLVSAEIMARYKA